MAKILRHFVDDIAKDLSQVFDDRKVTKVSIAHAAIMLGDNIKAQHIKKRSSGAFMTSFDDVTIQISETSGDNLVKRRYFFELPQCIYDFNMDKGIDYIAYSAHPDLKGLRPPIYNQVFTRTTPSSIPRLMMNGYEKPDIKNPYFYRSKEKVYLLGLDCIDPEDIKLEMGLYTTLKPVTEIDLDAPFDFPEETLAILKRQVLDMSRFALLVPQERVNDGADNVNEKGVPTSKISSVNDIKQD